MASRRGKRSVNSHAVARSDHRADDQKGADGLQRRHGAGGQQGKEQQLQAAGVQANRAGVVFIKEGHHQVFPLQQQNRH